MSGRGGRYGDGGGGYGGGGGRGGRGGYDRDDRGYGGGRGGGGGGRGGYDRDDRGYGGGGGGRGGRGGGGYGDRDRDGGGRGGYGGGGRGGYGGGGDGDRQSAQTYSLNEGQLVSNFYPMKVDPKATFYQLGVDFGGVESRSLRKSLARLLLDKVTKSDPELADLCIFDGTSIYSVVALLDPKDRNTFTFDLHGRDYNVSIVSIQELVVDASNPSLCQIFNIILKRAMEESLHRIGRNYYDLDKRMSLNPQLDRLIRVLPGFQTEIAWKKFGEKDLRLVLNVDTISKVISQSTVLSLMQQIANYGPYNLQAQAEIRRALVGTIVFTEYNTTAYTIENIDFKMSPHSTFTMANRQTGKEESISYIEYYEKIKNTPITDANQPLIRTSGRNKRKIYLIPEHCLISEIDLKAKERLPQVCSVKPPERRERIESLPKILKEGVAKKVLDTFKLSVDAAAIKVKGRTIRTPALYMPGQGTFSSPQNWGRILSSKLRFSAGQSTQITAYVTYEAEHEEVAQDYCEAIKGELDKCGSPKRLRIVPVIVPRGQGHIDALKRAVPNPDKPAMLVCFLSDYQNKIRYGQVKEFANRLGYISQCINVSKQLAKSKNRVTLVGNIMKQILNKFGVLCWWSPISDVAPSLTKKTVMFVGIDVYHARKTFLDEENVYSQRRSIGAFCAVIVDTGLAASGQGGYRTSCDVIETTARKELLCKAGGSDEDANRNSDASDSERAAPELLEAPDITRQDALQTFIERSCKEHNVKPDLIVVYRDGVGDSQLEAVKETEVRQAIRASKGSKLVFMVVQKRIHSRFYVLRPDGAAGNPPPGTVIHQEMSHPDYQDFFMLSTQCGLSTAKPVHYVVVHNDNSVPMQELQDLTFALCHCYPNWSDSIKLPVPTQLAHKLAYQMGESLIAQPQIHPELYKTYFYL